MATKQIKKDKIEDHPDSKYCLVKYFHYGATSKHLECKNCVMNCKYKNITEGNKDDQPTN